MGTVRADAPRLDARDVPTPRGQPRRLAFGRGPAPARLGARAALRAARGELAALAAEGVQSLLLEGGPTLAGAFLEADLVDKMLVFVAPLLAGGDGPPLLPRLGSVRGPLPPERPAGRRGRPPRSLCPRARPVIRSQRTDDEIVSLLSQWLNGSLGNDELRKRIEQLRHRRARARPARRRSTSCSSRSANAFPGERGDLEMLVRETVESLAYGG